MIATQTNVETTNLLMYRAILNNVCERQKEIGRLIDERAERLDKQLVEMDNCFDEMIKDLVMPDLTGKFGEIGLVFTKVHPHTVIYDDGNNILTEVDITLENSDTVMIVKAKSKLRTEDVTDHVKRMELLRLYADLHGDKRKYLGAIAGMKFNEDEKQYALKSGFYLVELCVDTFVITVPEGGCSPKEW
jgi:hypothetical protein